MTLLLNGEDHATSAHTIADLIAELSLPAETLLIEHNSRALLRSDWPTTSLADSDRIEFLQVAAGG
ncbi:MAG: sulfur carrier protein ThiS [Chthoniobacterales bacterium]